MPHLGDALISYPVSGSTAVPSDVTGSLSSGVPPPLFLQTAQWASAARTTRLYYGTGSSVVGNGLAMTSGVPFMLANPNRRALFVRASGALPAGLGFGANVLQATAHRIVAPEATVNVYEGVPVYTGQVYAIWIGSGSVSGSAVFGTELTF